MQGLLWTSFPMHGPFSLTSWEPPDVSAAKLPNTLSSGVVHTIRAALVAAVAIALSMITPVMFITAKR